MALPKAFATVLHAIGFLVTAFRLHYRRRIQRLWWDDYAAGVALILDFLYVPLRWLSYAPTSA